jgi:hypothetical protein
MTLFGRQVEKSVLCMENQKTIVSPNRLLKKALASDRRP